MAALRSNLQFGSVALVAATAKTVWQLLSPTNQRVRILEVGIFFDGVTSTNASVLCELLTQTTAGTMSAGTMVKLEPSLSETVLTVGTTNASAEPTAGTVIRSWRIHPQGGQDKVDSYNVILAGATRVGLRLTAGAGVNVTGFVTVEE